MGHRFKRDSAYLWHDAVLSEVEAESEAFAE